MESDLSPFTENSQIPKESSSNKKPQRLLVCLGRSCRKYNSNEVFARFKQQQPRGVELVSVGCLGQCGNGPMVLVESDKYDQTWYSEVSPKEVTTVIKQHLTGQFSVEAMLYSKFHPQDQ